MMKNKWWSKHVDPEISDVVVALKVRLSGKVINKDWTEDLSLNYENLDEDMEQIPSVLAFWSAVLAEARKKKNVMEMKMDIRRSKVLAAIKNLAAEGVKMTVQDKENMVNVDEDFNKLRVEYIDIDTTVSKLFGIVESLKVKADNLRSFSSMKRAELHNS
jgi:hypothetical protein